MKPTALTKSLFEQAYHSMLDVLEDIHFDAKDTDFNWSRVKAFRYVMQLNSNALKKYNVKSPYYTVPYACRNGGSA